MLSWLPLSFMIVEKTIGENQSIFYPQAMAMTDHLWQQSMNERIAHEAERMKQQQVGDTPSTVVEMIGRFELKNNQREVLSLSLSNYTYHEKAAHGMTLMQSLTFDLESKQLCQLHDLFKPGSNYVDRLSELIALQIKERDIPLLDGFSGIQPDQDFYMADKSLVIYFQLYEISPYVVGFPMFPISVFDLQDIMNEQGALGRMAVNQ
ncbi:DUF3298 and DUF4163 domain-containing protein [Halalkalibacter sp. APA_J-10(15)]|uniref:DUF3298 and DUF4163 domain-containing protein n=1 Tax=Halalkalibacter sp. APA_J-10(15) TaxID=2933805 RepID=UPI001FF14C28|nr:DUF3298 and DUF4163 domain-containing protein [Halalkalibacter sp. APA_J-10(15)]MCK0469876.1 DUF3298 and DUF4163 domain-containing protein [Halalkalibacter sp. APA_J-10(15)]